MHVLYVRLVTNNERDKSSAIDGLPSFHHRASAWLVAARVGVLAAAFLLLDGFDSYRWPIQDVVSNSQVQQEMRKKLEAGKKGEVYAEHYEISYDCLVAAGVLRNVAESMATTVSDIDADNWRHMKDHYEAKNHCDRPKGKSDEWAFTEALRFHREKVAEAWHSWAFNDVQNVIKIFPRALHGLEDFFSHSNFVDLPPSAQDALVACWTRYAASNGKSHDENGALIAKDSACMGGGFKWNNQPNRLRITGYDPKASDPYAPAGDDFSHLLFAKDNPTYSPEAKAIVKGGHETKYMAARKAATAACKASTLAFKQACLLDAECRKYIPSIFK